MRGDADPLRILFNATLSETSVIPTHLVKDEPVQRVDVIAAFLSVLTMTVCAQMASADDQASLADLYLGSMALPDTDWTLAANDELIHADAVLEGLTGDVDDIRLVKQDVAPVQPPAAPAQQTDIRLPLAAQSLSATLFQSGNSARSLLTEIRRRRLRAPSTNLVRGTESRARATSDAGSLLRKSSASFGIGTQRRTPIVVDPRIRGSRVGRLAASGSHWVPARIDLDTMLSKIDSRVIDDIIVIKGPYSAIYGPDFAFMDVQLQRSPRYRQFPIMEGSSSLTYQSNGEQWYGRQTIQGGASDWGFRAGYGHRAGSDYEAGDGTSIPSSYKSREIDIALGYDFTPDSSIEFNYLKLDQTDVEFPGQAFDLDYLGTEGYEATWLLEDQSSFDRLTVDAWYNFTTLKGNAQNSGKRRQFPFFDVIAYEAFTGVTSLSAGYRMAFDWELADDVQLTAGTDLRFLKQELNEVSTGFFGFLPFTDANSPIPRSHTTNPGLFAQLSQNPVEGLELTLGTRVDVSVAELADNPAKLSMLGLSVPQVSLADILGTDQFDQSFGLWSAFLTGRYALDDAYTLTFGAGHAERPPTLTELYVAESFLFLLQNGQNTATGDPRLDTEKLWQLDVGMEYEQDDLRISANAFHAWIHDYITFENLRVFRGPPLAQVEQVSLKYVNTELATLAGFDLNTEWDASDCLTFFASASYVEGRDHTRNGSFATTAAVPGSPSTRVEGLSRGTFSGVVAGDDEPLPSILPLQSRVGLRLRDPEEDSRWVLELSARVVDNQDRVATSLLETPTPGFSVWDLRGSFRLADSVLATAGVENFTDKNYREHLDFRSENGIRMLQPGINFYLGAEVTY